jgi:alpha-amylase
VALNNSRTEVANGTLATCQPPGVVFRRIFDSRNPNSAAVPTLLAGAEGNVGVSLAPLQFIIWKAQAPLPVPSSLPSIRFAAPASGSILSFNQRCEVGQIITERQELRADVAGGDGFAEVTFTMERASRPNQFELLGTEDAPPYKVFWRPPADLAPGDTLTFIATVDDLRGHSASAKIDNLRVTPSSLSFGIKGATVPVFTLEPDPVLNATEGKDLTLTVSATGTEPLEYRWLHDGSEIAGATLPVLSLEEITDESAGHYVALVRNREGTVISRDVLVQVNR